jgi:tetratricopeptide (TPR) repeat protein
VSRESIRERVFRERLLVHHRARSHFRFWNETKTKTLDTNTNTISDINGNNFEEKNKRREIGEERAGDIYISKKNMNKMVNTAPIGAETATTKKGVDPKQVPVIVMYSVGKAEEAIREREYAKAKKMMESTDALCSRYGAPPPVHGLALRILADACEQGARSEGTSEEEKIKGINEAKKCLRKGLSLCEPHFGAKGLPPTLERDLNGRAGDLHAALGELHRNEGEFIEALQNFREAVKKFGKLESKDLCAASVNRMAYTFINMKQWDDALKELKYNEELGPILDSRSEILSTTYNFKGECLVNIGGKDDEAKKAYTEALKHALACGHESVREQASAYLDTHGGAGEDVAPDAYI